MPVTIGYEGEIPQSIFDANKVSNVETFLNDVLRTDLRITLERRDELYNQIAQYMQLQTVLEKVGEATTAGGENTKLKTRVDIGSNFYVQASIPDTKTVTVDIGCGIWLPMSSKDALAFCEKKIAFFNTRVSALTQQELNYKAQINIVIQGLKEMQKVGNSEPKPRYES